MPLQFYCHFSLFPNFNHLRESKSCFWVLKPDFMHIRIIYKDKHMAGGHCFYRHIFSVLPLWHLSGACFTCIITLWSIFIQILSYQYWILCPKMWHKNFENWFTYLKLGFCIDKGDNPKSLTLNSDKSVNLIQTFGPLVSDCLSNLAILYGLCILDSSFLYWPLLCGYLISMLIVLFFIVKVKITELEMFNIPFLNQ